MAYLFLGVLNSLKRKAGALEVDLTSADGISKRTLEQQVVAGATKCAPAG